MIKPFKRKTSLFLLLSSEFETVFSKEIQDRMVTFKFLEEKNGQLKVHSTISKKARGAFVTAFTREADYEGRRDEAANL